VYFVGFCAKTATVLQQSNFF